MNFTLLVPIRERKQLSLTQNARFIAPDQFILTPHSEVIQSAACYADDGSLVLSIFPFSSRCMVQMF